MQELLMEPGRVCGALVVHEGKVLRIHARQGVLLATGGFSHNTDLRRRYQQAPTGADWTASAPGATGDAVLMGEKIGAALGFMDCAWWSPTYTIPDGRVLALTVTTFNQHARNGEDPEFARGVSEHDRYYADKTVGPNPSLGPVDTPPYYALRCDPGDLDTKGGLACDEHGRVLDNSGAVITGLYAAGNASAAVMGNTYPGAGATIGSAMTFAYLAALHAFDNDTSAQQAQEKP